MWLIAVVLLDFQRQHPFLHHIDTLEVEVDAQQADVLTSVDLYATGVLCVVAHVLIVEVDDVSTVGWAAEKLVVQDVECVTMTHLNGEIAAVGGCASHDDRQVVARLALAAVHQRTVIIVTGVRHVDCRHAVVVDWSLEADILLILLVLPLVVAGSEANSQ